MSSSRQRGRYRVAYPAAAAPSFETEGRTYSVLDCSESGLRFSVEEGGWQTPADSEVSGVVRFVTGSEVEVSGRIAWEGDGSVAIHFDGDGISFRTMLAEQQYLRRTFVRDFQDQR